jgi:hypothetical protein
LKTFFTNDWQHSIFVGNAPKSYKTASKITIGSQIGLSITALILCQKMNNQLLTWSSIYAVLLSVLNLSNATKNKKDIFSTFVQSYFSKLHNAMYFAFIATQCEGSMQIVMGLLSAVMFINAAIGINLLNKLMRKVNTNVVIIENLIEDVSEDIQ